MRIPALRIWLSSVGSLVGVGMVDDVLSGFGQREHGWLISEASSLWAVSLARFIISSGSRMPSVSALTVPARAPAVHCSSVLSVGWQSRLHERLPSKKRSFFATGSMWRKRGQ